MRVVFELRNVGRAVTASVLALVAFGACAINKKEGGGVIGATAGGAVGAVIGNQTGSTARGAIIGAVVGGAAGAIIGHQMDQQAKELKQNIAGATVRREGKALPSRLRRGCCTTLTPIRSGPRRRIICARSLRA